MKIISNYDITALNTFGVKARAKLFAEVHSEQDIQELFGSRDFKKNKKMFLGGGSNVLFTKNFHGLIILNKLKGIKIIKEDSKTVLIKAFGGELWHDLVKFAVQHDYWGIENLSLIPGTVGAAPMQNIGAYGAELKDTLINVGTYEIKTGKEKNFNKKECALGYRESVFKKKLKGKYFISSITLKLSKLEKKNISYKVLKEYLDRHNLKNPSLKNISDAVIAIRQSKLPDPKIIGNAGSFFKNVFVKKITIQKMLQKYPDMPYFEEDKQTKIPAGWLIEHSGPKKGTSWKGYRAGKVGVHERQALVLVNHGGATGREIIALAYKIIKSVKVKFGLELIPEVNIV